VIATLLVLGLVLVLLGGIVAGPALRSAAGAVGVELKVPDEAALEPLGQRSIMYAADGSVLAVLHDEIDRRIVALDQVPEHLRNAVITAEDRKFWEHRGYDLEGMGRALMANIRARGVAQGGSTITQQLAKTIVGSEQTLDRKLTELAYAVALEQELSKDQLLERYLNQVYFGAGAYGVAAAAEQFFGVGPESLTVEQAAVLASLIRSPVNRDPRRDPDGALQRRNAILTGMVEEGHLTPEEGQVAMASPLSVVPPRPTERREPYIVAAVIDELVQNPALGASVEERYDRIYSGGLRIHTAVDPRLQGLAEGVVNATFSPDGKGPTGAIATVDPHTGRVLAAMGGSNFDQESFNLATQGRRQPGSSFKPFVYAAALQHGYALTMSLPGAGTTFRPAGREPWPVSNYGGANYGRLTMADALKRSVNTAAASLILTVGPERACDLAAGMGIDMQAATGGDCNPALVLGGFFRGITPLEMASAYGTFANGGQHIQAHFVDRITDASDQELYRFQGAPQQVLDPKVNAAMVDLMEGVVRGGTGTAARLGGNWPVAGKTGTTDRNTDAWFVGYTPTMSTAVWTGYKEGSVSMGRSATGGARPATMWRQFMTRALEGQPAVPFPEVGYGRRPLSTGETVTVPEVRRLSESQALQVLGDAKLAGQVRSEYSRAAAGTVVWQSPDAGQVIEAGELVYIGVSKGSAPPPSPPPPPSPSPSPSPSQSQDKDEGDGGKDDQGGDTDGGDTGGEGGGDSGNEDSGNSKKDKKKKGGGN
jgi:penicillin-binding protein 1A